MGRKKKVKVWTGYILHFVNAAGEEVGFKHAHHYLGITSKTPEERLFEHVNDGYWGAKLVQAAVASGLTPVIAATFENVDGYEWERKMKARGSIKRTCPCCKRKAQEEKHARA